MRFLFPNWCMCAALIFLFLSPNAFGWGKVGHRTIGALATHYLDENAKKELKGLLGHTQLFDIAYFADEFRETKKGTVSANWHYANIAENSTYEKSPKNPKGDLVWAILNFSKILSDKKRPENERLMALKFIVHYVGDLHQPLHLGLKKDRGGNEIKVRFLNRKSNLHQVWDRNLLEAEKYSFSEWVMLLSDKMKTVPLKEWVANDLLGWVSESKNISSAIYKNKGPKLSYGYQNSNRWLLEERLMKAGYRLAYLLNRIFEGQALLQSEEKLLKQLKVDNGYLNIFR